MNNSSNQEGKKNYVRLSHSAGSNQKMYGSGETDVTSDENGNIRINTIAVTEEAVEERFNAMETRIANVANGVNRSYAFDSVDKLILDLEEQSNNAKYKSGDMLYIRSADQPDYWVAEVKSAKGAAVTRIADGATVGYWVLYKLGEKTDLTLYQTKTDSGFNTTNKTVTGAVNEVKSTADNAISWAGSAVGVANEVKDKFDEMGYSYTYYDTEKPVCYLNNTAALVAYRDMYGNKIGDYIKDLSVSGKEIRYTQGDGRTGGITVPGTTYAKATSTALGLVKIGYTASGRNYPVALDTDGKMYVNVPGTDTTYTLPLATTTVRGGNKVGGVRSTAITTNTASSTSGRYYTVERDSNEKLFVNVPWANTTYNAATTSAAGLMSAADKTKLDSPNSISETWYLQDNSCYVNAKAFINKPGGYVKIYGQVSLRTSNGPTYGILNIVNLAKKFSMINVIKKEKFMQGWWTYTRATNNSTDLTGYGTSIWTDRGDEYLRFGRVYTSSGSSGAWSRADIAGGAHYGTVSFEVYFKL